MSLKLFIAGAMDAARSRRAALAAACGRGGRASLVIILCITIVASVLLAGPRPASAADVVNISVPYVHQTNDTMDDFGGYTACGATCAVMLAALYDKIDEHPITCLPGPHTSLYGWYVSENYTNSLGYTFDRTTNDSNGNPAQGAYGYIHYSDGYSHSAYVVTYLQRHGLTASKISYPTEAQVKAELDAGYPVYADTSVTSVGHDIVIKGYTDDGYYITNDPYYGADKKYTWSQMYPSSSRWIVKVHGTTADTTPPTVTVTSPNGGETWKTGAQYNITWTATDANGVTSVAIYASPDGGSTYPTTIATGETNDSTYSWTVPDSVSATCRVKVVARDATGNSGEDSSNANFEITDTMPGDANNDGRVDGLDITATERMILGLITSYADADANSDGKIDALDITMIEQYIVSA